jgi:hypothetical protein
MPQGPKHSTIYSAREDTTSSASAVLQEPGRAALTLMIFKMSLFSFFSGAPFLLGGGRSVILPPFASLLPISPSVSLPNVPRSLLKFSSRKLPYQKEQITHLQITAILSVGCCNCLPACRKAKPFKSRSHGTIDLNVIQRPVLETAGEKRSPKSPEYTRRPEYNKRESTPLEHAGV